MDKQFWKTFGGTVGLGLLVILVIAASPSFLAFNSNQFGNDGSSKVWIRDSANVTNLTGSFQNGTYRTNQFMQQTWVSTNTFSGHGTMSGTAGKRSMTYSIGTSNDFGEFGTVFVLTNGGGGVDQYIVLGPSNNLDGPTLFVFPPLLRNYTAVQPILIAPNEVTGRDDTTANGGNIVGGFDGGFNPYFPIWLNNAVFLLDSPVTNSWLLRSGLRGNPWGENFLSFCSAWNNHDVFNLSVLAPNASLDVLGDGSLDVGSGMATNFHGTAIAFGVGITVNNQVTTINGGLTLAKTNVAPADAATVKRWFPVTNNGVQFLLPSYQ